MKDLYYMVELTTIDGTIEAILVKDKDLGEFLNNIDKDNYTLVNVYGIGQVNLNYRDFLKKDVELEKGSK